MSYTHLSEHERYLIGHLHATGQSRRQIALQLKRDPGTIARELRRNCASGSAYGGLDAHHRAQRRRRAAAGPTALAGGRLLRYVASRLRHFWSPQQIAGRLPLDYPDDPTMRISHEAIYQWVYQNRRHGGDMYQCLRQGRPRRRKRRGNSTIRGQIPGRVGIEQRPAIVDSRQRFGDWEADTVQGAKGRGCLVTHVERRSRYTLAGRAPDQRARTFNAVTIRLFRHMPRHLRHTVTGDNGKELALFKALEKKLGVRVYFADPYSAWQRGTNENTNGLLRQFFPKGMPLDQVTDQQVAKAARLLNNRPRKCLGYRTPREVLPRGVALRS
jgi:transposase, IS30 family